MLSAFSHIRFGSLNIKPIGSRIVVQLEKINNGKIGNIIVPESAQKTPNMAVVKAVGPGSKIDGKFVPTTLKVGDKVLMPEFGGQKLKFKNEEYIVIHEDDILAVLD